MKFIQKIMKYLNIWRHIKLLFNDGTDWEFKEILLSNAPVQSTLRLSWKKRSVLALPSIIICYFLSAGFSSEFIGYAMAALSIFIGLFTNLIVVVYGRYSILPNINSITNNQERLNIVRLKNFIKQFTFVTGKNLLISTYLIFLMCIIMLFSTYFAFDLKKYQIIKDFAEINAKSICNFADATFITVIRFQVIYLLIDFFVLLLYSLGALFAFLKGEYN